MRRLYTPGHQKLWIPEAWTVWTFDNVYYALIEGRLFERMALDAPWRESTQPIAMVT